jgi:hypothetical protein
MGPPPRSFAAAADAHDCIMVLARTEPAGYKFVARCSRLDGELPSDGLTLGAGLSWTGSKTKQKPHCLASFNQDEPYSGSSYSRRSLPLPL